MSNKEFLAFVKNHQEDKAIWEKTIEIARRGRS